MVRQVHDNLLHAKTDVICHQVNCQGKMGSGVARQIREAFPEAYKEYQRLCNKCCGNPRKLLGICQMVEVERDGRKFYIANLFGQLGYGYDGQQYTSIDGFRQGIKSLRSSADLKNIRSVAMPYKIGCGRGGADWEEIFPIIDEGLRDLDVTLFEYKE